MSHTPGPWEIEKNPEPHSAYWIHHRRQHVTDNVGLYNARLIAAAPDLLNALQAIDAVSCGGPAMYGGDAGMLRRCNEIARAAIAKATA